MKFIGRTEELNQLKKITTYAQTSGYLTMITGRRRVGKTTLVKHFVDQNQIDHCYLFVSRKESVSLLNEFSSLLAEKFPHISGLRFSNFDGLLTFIFQMLKSQPYTFIFDEFQNFTYIDPAIFSIFQKYWDENKDHIKGHIIVIGSIQTLMHRIFESNKEPLFKRLTGKIILKPFHTSEMKTLFHIHNEDDWCKNLQLQLIFNGIPFYYALLEKLHLFDMDLMALIDEIALRHDSLLFNEGKELTIEEFGKNYGRYFSIIEAIAGGHTQWNAIATQTGISPNSIGKYLDELMNLYGIIERIQSMFSNQSGKKGRYYLKDNFMAFWFRYIYKNYSILENFGSSHLLAKIKSDLPNFFGYQFERFICNWLQRQCLEKNSEFPFDFVGKFWDRGKNEIDIVAYQKNYDLCLVGECKMNSNRITRSAIHQLFNSMEFIQQSYKFKSVRGAFFTGDLISRYLVDELAGQNIEIFDVRDYYSNSPK